MDLDEEEFLGEEDIVYGGEGVDLEANDDEDWGSDFGEDGNYSDEEE